MYVYVCMCLYMDTLKNMLKFIVMSIRIFEKFVHIHYKHIFQQIFFHFYITVSRKQGCHLLLIKVKYV